MIRPITNENCILFFGLSSDPKSVILDRYPKLGGGSIYIEIDTSSVYIFEETSKTWVVQADNNIVGYLGGMI